MNKDKLLSKICPVYRVRGCCKGDEVFNCDDCNRVLEEWFDEYDKHTIEQYEANTKLSDTTREIRDNVAWEMYCKGVDELTERLKDYFVIPHDVMVIETIAKTVKETKTNDYTRKKITTDRKDTPTSVQEGICT